MKDLKVDDISEGLSISREMSESKGTHKGKRYRSKSKFSKVFDKSNLNASIVTKSVIYRRIIPKYGVRVICVDYGCLR